jgi:cytochrome c peroxidase
MNKEVVTIYVTVTVLAGLCISCGKKSSEPAVVTIDKAQLEMFTPLPEVMTSESNPITEEKVSLGRMLYYETRLSKAQELSCNSCHILTSYGVDGKPTSDGHKGQKGDRNSPTVYNAAGQFAQFWDGRAADVEAQAKGPVLNPVEMAMPAEKQVVAVLKSMREYADGFKKAFPQDKDPVNYDNMAKAIGAFERKLVTPSRWDKLLHGDQAALTNTEKAGFNDFMEAGCETCHSGTYLGGNQYQRLGNAKPWPDSSDPGREKVTKKQSDHMVFKIPILRNIEKTAPYFHNGKVATLDQAISLMAEYQLGKQLSPQKVTSIGSFLASMTGDFPADYIKQPELPKSTSKTPKPEVD